MKMKLPEFKSAEGQDFEPLNVHLEITKAVIGGLMANPGCNIKTSQEMRTIAHNSLITADAVIEKYQERGWL